MNVLRQRIKSAVHVARFYERESIGLAFESACLFPAGILEGTWRSKDAWIRKNASFRHDLRMTRLNQIVGTGHTMRYLAATRR